jgi:diguanylate cyclase (GGDEF)-like protein/PAS domain S-box-containing protein
MAEVLAPIRPARRRILEATLLIALLVAPLVWFGVRRIYDPLDAILHEREAGLHRAQVMAGLAHVVTGPDGSFESWSETLPKLAGVAPEHVPKSTREWLDLLHPDDRDRFRGKSIESGIKRERSDLEYRVQHPDGTSIHVRQTMEPLADRGEAGGALRWFNTLQDITGQKHAELKIERLNRVYAVLSGINSLIVRAPERDELFREACRIAVEHGQFKMAWIAVVDRTAMNVVPVASTGAEPEFLAMIKDRFSLREDAPMGNTMTARAVREKRPVVENEMKIDSFVFFGKERMARGISSMAILPLLVSDEAFGVLALYADQKGFFDEQEMKLLVELAGDISFALEHIEKSEKLDYLAYYDSLTGLANRTLFHERLEQNVAKAGMPGNLAVFILDVERFKTLNDTFGRVAGDGVLKEIAARLLRIGADPSRFARVGADRFAMFAAKLENEEMVASHINQKLEACFGPPYRVGGEELRISAKVGIAVYPGDGTDADTLFRNAEEALKKAKAGGDKYLFYAQEMTERVAERLSLESKLRQALEREEFVLYYQPKVDGTTRAVLSVEALIRWRSPELGLVPPMKFISLLEETGLILQVGTWALKRAALDHRAWGEAGLAAPRVAVNVSPVQLRQRDFVATVEQAILQGASPMGIDVEITESVIMGDIEGNREKLNAIRALGASIAIDDFGTGYSSLAYLAKLPVETLKIDRAFIAEMMEDPDAATLVHTMISLAHSLRLKVVAEGVETEDQAKMLTLLRCDQMQGYLFSKPLPAEELVAMLRKEAGQGKPG